MLKNSNGLHGNMSFSFLVMLFLFIFNRNVFFVFVLDECFFFVLVRLSHRLFGHDIDLKDILRCLLTSILIVIKIFICNISQSASLSLSLSLPYALSLSLSIAYESIANATTHAENYKLEHRSSCMHIIYNESIDRSIYREIASNTHC